MNNCFFRALVPCESRYPLVGESAGLIKEHKTIQVSHHLLTVQTEIALMPSVSFSGSLTQLVARTTQGQDGQGTQNNSQRHLTCKNRNAFHQFSFFLSAGENLYPLAAQNAPLFISSLYKPPAWLSTQKCMR
jgi:hypothetical protein